MHMELTRENGPYVVVNEKEEDVIERHKVFLKKFALPCVEKVPKLFALPKFHKNPTGWRFIAGSAKCSTKSGSQFLQKILANVLRTLREKDDRNLARTGIRRYLVGDSFETSNFLGTTFLRFCDYVYQHTSR